MVVHLKLHTELEM